MTFTFQTLHVHANDMISVRVIATDGASASPCGTLVFSADEWLAFHARLLGREVARLEMTGVDEVLAALRAGPINFTPGGNPS